MPLYKKIGKELVFDLINEANPQDVPFTSANSTIEAVTAGNWTVDGNTYNTRARLRGMPNLGWTGTKVVYYNRLVLSTLFDWVTLTIETFTAPDVHGALSVVNRNYGVMLTTADVNNATLASPNVPNYTNTVSLTAAPLSPLLAPGSVTMRYNRGLPYLDVYVVDKNLVAYQHPVTDDTRQSAQMLTFGLDFSDYKNLLTVTAAGMPNFAGLSNLLTQTYGLPQWDAPLNSNYVTDNATSAVTNANQLYDRVVVQTGISNGQVVGYAYYHYMN